MSMTETAELAIEERLVRVTAGPVTLDGNLNLPEGARAVVLFAHGSGSGRHSSRNRHVAHVLNEAKLATLLIDLLTSEEEAIDMYTAHLDISAPAPAPLPRSWRRRSAPSGWARSCRAAAVPTWPGRHWVA